MKEAVTWRGPEWPRKGHKEYEKDKRSMGKSQIAGRTGKDGAGFEE